MTGADLMPVHAGPRSPDTSDNPSNTETALPPFTRMAVTAALTVLSLPAIALRAEAQTNAATFDPDSALAAELNRLPGQPIGLEDAVALALTGATDVMEARASRDAALAARLTEKGTFDPELFADVTRSRDETPSSSPFSQPDVIENETTATTAGARVRLPIGTEIEAAVGATKVETNSAFAAIDPEYRADGRLEVRQPLLKGFGAGTASALSAAARGAEAAESGYLDAQLSMRARVETTYWQLYAAERDVAVQALIVDRAAALLEQATLRADAGLVGPNEVANARVFLAEQRLASLDRREALAQTSDRLATLLGVRPDSGQRYRPADEPPSAYPVDDVDSSSRVRTGTTTRSSPPSDPRRRRGTRPRREVERAPGTGRGRLHRRRGARGHGAGRRLRRRHDPRGAKRRIRERDRRGDRPGLSELVDRRGAHASASAPLRTGGTRPPRRGGAAGTRLAHGRETGRGRAHSRRAPRAREQPGEAHRSGRGPRRFVRASAHRIDRV